MIGRGDYLQAEVNYSEGAIGYVNASTAFYQAFNGGAGGTVGIGLMSDGIYGGTVAGANASSVQLTTSWGVNAAYEHFWSPHWQTSVYGAYIKTEYNSSANAMICAAVGAGTGSGTTAVANPGCNTNWGVWNIAPGRNGTSTRRPIWVSTLCTRTSRRCSAVKSLPSALATSLPCPVRSPIRARGCLSSACIATSIPDRLIKVKFA